jgi:hypothetical protein
LLTLTRSFSLLSLSLTGFRTGFEPEEIAAVFPQNRLTLTVEKILFSLFSLFLFFSSWGKTTSQEMLGISRALFQILGIFGCFFLFFCWNFVCREWKSKPEFQETQQQIRR